MRAYTPCKKKKKKYNIVVILYQQQPDETAVAPRFLITTKFESLRSYNNGDPATKYNLYAVNYT